MTLRLSIENLDRLPDGGPLRVEVKGRGLDIGRDAHLDWTLPDPSRYVSGKHCEIRYRDGEYWLHDVSTNGTFVNGAQFRLDAPYRLRDGDRLSIGPYLIAVAIEGEARAAQPAAAERLRRRAARTSGARSATSRRPTAATPIACATEPATPGDFLDFATLGSRLPPRRPRSGRRRARPTTGWLAAAPAPPPPPPPPPDPRELPIVERPRPMRPAEPAARRAAAAPAPPAPVAAPPPAGRRSAGQLSESPRCWTASPTPPASRERRSPAAIPARSPTRSARRCG